jgi:hypothetical protein
MTQNLMLITMLFSGLTKVVSHFKYIRCEVIFQAFTTGHNGCYTLRYNIGLWYRHAYAVSNNPRSMDASMKPPTSTSKLFPNAPPHMTPRGSLQLAPTCTKQSFRTNRSTHPLRYVYSSKHSNGDLSIVH